MSLSLYHSAYDNLRGLAGGCSRTEEYEKYVLSNSAIKASLAITIATSIAVIAVAVFLALAVTPFCAFLGLTALVPVALFTAKYVKHIRTKDNEENAMIKIKAQVTTLLSELYRAKATIIEGRAGTGKFPPGYLTSFNSTVRYSDNLPFAHYASYAEKLIEFKDKKLQKAAKLFLNGTCPSFYSRQVLESIENCFTEAFYYKKQQIESFHKQFLSRPDLTTDLLKNYDERNSFRTFPFTQLVANAKKIMVDTDSPESLRTVARRLVEGEDPLYYSKQIR